MLTHETLDFRREFPVVPKQLFEAYADAQQRQIWSPPSPDETVIIDEYDFRTGGHEIARCGAKGNPAWTTKVKYHVVEEDVRIVFTEELWQSETILTVALISFQIEGTGNSSRLTLTDQVTSWVGTEGIEGHRFGYPKALNNLELLLAEGKSDA